MAAAGPAVPLEFQVPGWFTEGAPPTVPAIFSTVPLSTKQVFAEDIKRPVEEGHLTPPLLLPSSSDSFMWCYKAVCLGVILAT